MDNDHQPNPGDHDDEGGYTYCDDEGVYHHYDDDGYYYCYWDPDMVPWGEMTDDEQDLCLRLEGVIDRSFLVHR